MITVLYTYFGQLERIPQIVEQNIPTMIVDDCSPIPLGLLDNIKVIRIIDDIKWNQPGARNLGFQELNDWVLCCDIDHLVTKEVYDKVSKLELKIGTVYFLGRNDISNSTTVYLMHKDDFEKIGGYDEDFCGNYGYDDIHFFKKCSELLNIKTIYDIKVDVYARESSSIGNRDIKNNSMLYQSKKLDHTPRIRFKWEYVK